MDFEKLREMYWNKGYSTWEMGRKLKISQWQVVHLMRKYDIPRRTASETRKIQFERKPLSYNKRKKLSSKEQSLYEAALMLYWAEGVKVGEHTVDFTNSDKRMVQIFLSCLRNIYRVKEDRLRVLLYCYANQDQHKLIKFWSKALSISPGQFTKPYMRQDFNRNKKHKMSHGLVHIRYNDKRLFSQIFKDIDIISNKLLKIS